LVNVFNNVFSPLDLALILPGIAVALQLYDDHEWLLVSSMLTIITFYVATWHYYVTNANVFGL
jgi:hypothetical protein